jgi:hypothetical protein
MGMKQEQFDKLMEGDITGWTAYLALEKVLKGWYELTGNEYAEWLYTNLRCDTALMVDWAKAMKEAIEERGEGNKTELVEEISEEYKEHLTKKMKEKAEESNRNMKDKEENK